MLVSKGLEQPQIMASVNTSVFNKLKILSTRQEGDGHEIQVEVREDEDQSIKLQEIIDLLVAAGYFRARIKGLSPFDKVVGGMTWCISSCNVDVDVDLLFHENSTIGQKIALTEKIVAVLPKMKCPYAIEPHQIQGLDFIHIFPVIQWLVKRSMEFRQEISSFVQCFALNQFKKCFPLESKRAKVQIKVLGNINAVNDLYKPHRLYMRKTAPPEDIQSRVQITLLEYEDIKNIAINNSSELIPEEKKLEELEMQQLLNNMTLTEDSEYRAMNEEETKVVLNHYTALQSEMEDCGTKAREQKNISALEQQKRIFEEKCTSLCTEKDKLLQQTIECSEAIQEICQKQQKAKKPLLDLEESMVQNAESAKEIEHLVILNDDLRSQELKFREHCKQELTKLQNLIEEAKKVTTPVEISNNAAVQMDDQMKTMKTLRLQLAKKNRSIVALQRQLDEVPSRAELAQYQRRFLELYNQVAAKHKETKQYFALYNTLEDSRSYLKKELSVLNSISDTYPQAMLSNSGKEDFLKQMEQVADSVGQSRHSVDRKLSQEKQKRDEMSRTLQSLVDQQRRYVTAVRQLSIEYSKHEALLSDSQPEMAR